MVLKPSRAPSRLWTAREADRAYNWLVNWDASNTSFWAEQLERSEAARFSFLIGLPAIALAGLKEIYELHKAGLETHGWLILATGIVVASISAFFAIWGLMRVLERVSSWPFVIYRALLGIYLLTAVSMGWLH